ncbi:MAG TPA: hypothetical protein VF183_15880 [Acidimicrobiales bacterium]
MNATVEERSLQSGPAHAPERAPEAAWRRRGRRRLAVAFIVVAVLAVASALPFRTETRRYHGQPLVLVASAPSAERWRTELRHAGLLVEVGPVDLDRRDLLVVPADATLEAETIDGIVAWVRDGGVLVSPHAELLSAAGLVLEESRSIDAVRVQHVEAERSWPRDVLVRAIGVDRGARPAHALVSASDFTIAARQELGAGRILALGWDPFAGGRSLAETAPRLVDWIIDSVALAPIVERDGVHLYFMPALARYRYGRGFPLDALADQLAVASVVYVDGSDAGAYAGANLDPAALVDALHDRGVLTYLWLAPHRLTDGWEALLSAAEWDGVHVTTDVDPAGRDAATQTVIETAEAHAATRGRPVTVGGPVDDLGTPLEPLAAIGSGAVISTGGAALADASSSADLDQGLRVFAFGLLDPVDLVSLPRMLSASAKVDGSVIESDQPLVVHAPDDEWHELYVNGKPYPNAGGSAVLPAGRNEVEWRKGYHDGPGIVRTSVRLRSVSTTRERLSFTYDASTPGLIVVDDRPTELDVDGERHDLVIREHDGTFVIRLPAGEEVSATLRFD